MPLHAPVTHGTGADGIPLSVARSKYQQTETPAYVIFLNNPAMVPQTELLTEIYLQSAGNNRVPSLFFYKISKFLSSENPTKRLRRGSF